MSRVVALALASGLLGLATGQAAANPLPSWADGDARDAIVEFVESVSNAGSNDFVPVADRIAVFDNDGTLWQNGLSISNCCTPSTCLPRRRKTIRR